MRNLWTTGALLLLAAPAQAADIAAEIADALLPLMAERGASVDRATAEAALHRQIAALDAEPLLAEKLPAAFLQAARLALTAEQAATRGMMIDITRECLATGAGLAGDPGADPLIAAWQAADPLLHETSGGAGLARSDIDAIATLRRLAGVPAGDVAAEVEAEWQRLAVDDANLVFPGRFEAWAMGAEAAWNDLAPDERAIAAGILESSDVPSDAVFRKVTGTDDFVHWIAAMDVPMTAAERRASPELVELLEMGAFAGPLQAPLLEIAADAAAIAGMGAGNGAAMQMMRLNNWAAWTGDGHSSAAMRYSTEGW